MVFMKIEFLGSGSVCRTGDGIAGRNTTAERKEAISAVPSQKQKLTPLFSRRRRTKKFFGAAIFQKCCRGVGEQPTVAKQIKLSGNCNKNRREN